MRLTGLNSHLDVGRIPKAGAGYLGAGTWTDAAPSRSRSQKLSREQLIRLAVLSLFCDPLPERCSQLVEMSAHDWERLMRWLDLSGLALYFLDRVVELKLCSLLPTAVFTRLHLNLIDNTERTRHMLLESMRIQRDFQQAEISYALLKGISLWPAAVSKPELRSQFDLDFLIAEQDATAARGILERSGYRQYAVSGRSSEFKKNERPGVSLKDIYRHFDSYGVELHAARSGIASPVLDRVQWRDVNGMAMPVLNPIDLFLGHGMHAFKHVCGEYARAAQFVEFRRHVLRYRDDEQFWRDLRQAAEGDQRVSLGLGLVLYLISDVMGEFVPEGLASWTSDRLPDRLRLWARTYGHRVVVSDHPGTKLYLILQGELERCGIEGKRSTRSSLLPAQLPPPVIRPFADEGWGTRLRRNLMQLETILERARFHVVEGIRYAVEARRWRRLEGSLR